MLRVILAGLVGGLVGGLAGFAAGIFAYPYIFLADIVASEQVEGVETRLGIRPGERTNLFTLIETLAGHAQVKEQLKSIKPKPPSGNEPAIGSVGAGRVYTAILSRSVKPCLATTLREPGRAVRLAKW